MLLSNSDSVISSSSRRGARLAARTLFVTIGTKSSFLNWTTETLTASLIYFGQVAASAQAVLQNPFAERHDEPDFLGERNEFRRRDQAARRMVPAQQGLETADLVFAQIEDRLIEDFEFVVR